MKRSHPYRALLCLIALATMTACSVSTAHISSLKIAKDNAFTTAATTFAPTDTIYAQAAASNLPNAVTLQWHLIAEKVTGQAANTKISALDKSENLPSDGTSTYTLSAPTAGWPTGTYKIEVDMMDNGTQRDQKTAEITVGS
jgi:hypothetical protein